MVVEARLGGKVAIVTGAGGGLGAACAKVMAARGAKLAVTDIRGEAAEAIVAQIQAAGGEAMAATMDVSSEAQVAATVGLVMARFGRIDILHNNAGLVTPEQRSRDRDVCNVDVEAWDRAFAVNLRGSFLCCKHVIPHMIQQGGGSIINVSSGFGAQGELTLSAYACSKAGLMALSRSVATQYGKQGVRCNTIQIGLVLSENAEHTLPPRLKELLRNNHLTPELGTPQQVADVVSFLASDESSFVTGHTLAVDGGFSAHAPTVSEMQAYFKEVGSNQL
jgi:NAD(P)-dependent dehydrogenase (short-subunit alcohol dehydrogenase family)